MLTPARLVLAAVLLAPDVSLAAVHEPGPEEGAALLQPSWGEVQQDGELLTSEQLRSLRFHHPPAKAVEGPLDSSHFDQVTPRTRQKTHKVEHANLLNEPGLWVLMACLIFCIGAMLMRMEYSRTTPTESKEADAVDDLIMGLIPRVTFFRIAFSVVGLNLSMLFWGIAQEYMMTTSYSNSSGKTEKMPSALCLVLVNRLVTILVSGCVLRLQGASLLVPGGLFTSMPAGTNLLASWCQYQSLAFVSFPLQTASKAAKLMPVLMLSSLRGKPHGLLDYAEGIVIVSALVVFGFEVESEQAAVHAHGLGVLFLLGMVFLDSLTPHLQDAMFKRYTTLTLMQATFSMASFASFFCLVVLLINGQLLASLAFFGRHPQAILHVMVLSLCSTLTQFLISYTIKHFGPVIFTLITTTRQLISVCVSAALFAHHISALAWLAATVVFCTIIGRAVRKQTKEEQAHSDEGTPSEAAAIEEASRPNSRPPYDEADDYPRRQLSLVDVFAAHKANHWKLLVCMIGIHIPLGFYSVAQEFMATHTFSGQLFQYPIFLIAANRTGAALFACFILKGQGLPILGKGLYLTAMPAAANVVATYCQYKALFFLRYPAQSLMKSVKVVPVMLVGRILKNRTYSTLDYIEGAVVTVLVSLFMYTFHADKSALQEGSGLLPGILLMLGYIVCDSFTSNIEDRIYQQVRMDPGQMLLGMQAFSGIAAWISLLLSGQLVHALHFLFTHLRALMHVLVLVMAEACGAYACTVTVRIFGPAVFTLLLMSHQILSLLVSVVLFNHKVGWLGCLCLAVVTLVILTSSLRRVSMQKPPAGKAVD